ncbi:type I restriction enzyme S subunit [Dysgonomonas sp. PFB1-18]|uniref:restriction endonuclease subunit S n=1 Tax=Dysgonomonas sp. PFB1-18 TaxID=2940633 RepID=UPI002474F9A7|nr:restriction endonuclease subunit S [Dysgonomonas sp. PFB1-18]MDH6382174.1 type I restriction enzyme S subunit [Dysgonomonas sp. PFB1-18]
MRFPEFEGEWEEKKLGEICKFVRGPFGSALKKEFFINDGYAVYEQSHAIHNNFDSFRYYISEEKFNSLRRFSVEPKDIIMSCSGTMGKFAIIPEKSKKGVINQALLKLTSKENFNHKFIKIALELPQIQNKLLSQSAGGAIKNVVGIPQLKEIGLYIPKPIEQNKIASFLSLIDQRIETQNKIIEDLKLLKSTIRNKIFEKIRKSDFKKLEIRDLLEHEQPTKYIVENVDYSENPTLIPVLTANKAFVLGYTDEQYGVYDKGDCIIFDDFTMDMKYVKFSFKVKSSAIKILTPKPEINLRYMFEYFSYLSLSSNEHKRHYISEVEDIKVSVPDVEKQNSIARLLLAFDRKIEVESSLCILLCNQKKYLLREMFI